MNNEIKDVTVDKLETSYYGACVHSGFLKGS